MDVHVICCNDAPMHAVMGTADKANKVMNTLRADDFERRRWQYPDFAQYRRIFNWHVNTVPLVD